MWRQTMRYIIFKVTAYIGAILRLPCESMLENKIYHKVVVWQVLNTKWEQALLGYKKIHLSGFCTTGRICGFLAMAID